MLLKCRDRAQEDHTSCQVLYQSLREDEQAIGATIAGCGRRTQGDHTSCQVYLQSLREGETALYE